MDLINKSIKFIENSRVLKHVLFWLVYAVINISMDLTSHGDILSESFFFNFLLMIPQVLASYLLTYIIIEKLLFTKKYIKAVLFFIVSTYFFSVLARILVVHVGEPMFITEPFEQESIAEISTDLKKLWVQYIPSILSVAFIFLFVKLFLETKRKNEETNLIAKEKSEIELKMLKAQLNPHFLFNTLNNIYSLSLDNSPKTPIAIGKLSEILDHILYKCDGQLVSLNSEIELLKNYIELEKLRYNDRLGVVFKSKIEKNFQIPPLLLLSLVENAFKHGAGEDSGSPKIVIRINQSEKKFTFEISNTVSSNYEYKGIENIGLTNIRKQLDLIFSNNYKLDLNYKSNLFIVNLSINQN